MTLIAPINSLESGLSSRTKINASFNKLSEYSSSYNYVIGEMTNYGGTLYKCIQNGTGQQPDTSPTYWEEYASGGTSSSVIDVIQTLHGYSVLQPIYYDTTTSKWELAQTDVADSIGTYIITEIVDVNNFKASNNGRFVLPANHSLTVGEWYFVSDVIAGAWTNIEPAISNPMVYVENANTVQIFPFRANTDGTGGAGGTYTGTADISVGNITAGQSFTNADMQEMWTALINQELFPVLTNPSSTFTLTQAVLQEVGASITLDFDSTFNRGSINPAYTTSGFRSGLPNQYTYTGTGLFDFPSTALTDTKSVAGYTILLGAQSWTGRVNYDAGEQPLSNYGNPYSSPLASGQTGTITRTITGVYPFFATTANITTLTQQALALMNSVFVQVTMVAESGVDKQKIDLPADWSTITGIQFYNTVSSSWEWLGGAKATSLTKFTQSATTHTIQGNVINYTRFDHNDVLTGSRQLRFYTN